MVVEARRCCLPNFSIAIISSICFLLITLKISFRKQQLQKQQQQQQLVEPKNHNLYNSVYLYQN
ncbi:hypothetical protein BpHYR1_050396 [Brachionus plicatilis]|uniref:Uncharacterized protein n=1 Tax=Brachionus plicatilis TaxID=10195 RepID=A0A3M7SBS5_BRAPC|nr:hypothetical protein BpHYR1_050396 [Brachionus plicatilis]